MGESTCRTLSNRVRTPRVLRVAPVNAFEHVSQLCRRDRNDAVRRRRPDKPAALQSLGVQRHAETVMPENLDQIASPPAEYEQIAGMRVALQSLLDLQSQPIHPAPHIGMPGRDPNPHTGGNRNHRTRALTTAAANSGGVNAAMCNRALPANSISIAGVGPSVARSLLRSSTAASTTSEKPPPVLRSSCRHR